MKSMTKRERCRAAVTGEKPDRIPYSLWSHMPQFDHDADAITEATYDFYKTYDVDFIKTMNNGMYAIEDFGCKIDYSEVPKGGVAKLVSSPIHEAADWLKLTPRPLDEGSLARELKYLTMLLERVKDDDVPVIFTVFSPITTANKLCGGKITEFIHQGYTEEVKYALEVITETTCRLAKKAIEIGADGVFLASQMSNYATDASAVVLTEDEYREYGKTYDVQILNAANEAGGWMNTLHCHGGNIMFDLLKDYPVQVFNWHAWESLPTIEEALALTDKCLMGGLLRSDITQCNRNAIRNQIYRCCKDSGGRHLILTPGCVIRYPLNDEMLAYVKKIKEFVESAVIGE